MMEKKEPLSPRAGAGENSELNQPGCEEVNRCCQKR